MSPTPSVEKDLGMGSQGMWQAMGGTGHVTGRWAVQRRSMAATGGMQGCGSCGGMRVDPWKKVRRLTVGAVAQAQRPHHQASWLGGAWHHLWKTSHSRVCGLGGVCKMMCTTLRCTRHIGRGSLLKWLCSPVWVGRFLVLTHINVNYGWAGWDSNHLYWC